jgi:hypothetical protein
VIRPVTPFARQTQIRPPALLGPRPAPRHPGAVVAASYLRALRIGRGLTRGEAASKVKVDPPMLMRIEGWLDQAPWEVMEELLRLYGIGDREHISAVRALTDDARHAELGAAIDQGPGWQDRLAAVENHASHTLCVGAVTWPGVLWPPVADRAMAAAQPPFPLLRRGLSSEYRGTIEVVVQESALRRSAGGSQTVAAQLAYVGDLMDSGRACVRILSMAAGPAVPSVSEIHYGRHVLYAGSITRGGISYRGFPEPATSERAQIQTTLKASLSPDESRSLITQALELQASGRQSEVAHASVPGAVPAPDSFRNRSTPPLTPQAI